MIFSTEPADNLLYSILNASVNGVVVLEPMEDVQQGSVDFSYVFVNKAARDQASGLKAVMPGMIMKKVLADSEFPDIYPVCHMVWITGQEYQGERYYSATNEWFSIHLVRLDDSRLIFTFSNITEYKQTVAKYQQEAELFQSVLETTANPVVVGLPVYRGNSEEIVDFTVRLFNQAAKEAWLFGSMLQVGASATGLLPQPERDQLMVFLCKAYQTGEIQRFQYRYPNSNRWLSLVVQRLDWGVIVNATDITEEREQQHTLRQMNRELEQSNENLQQFAYIASHDLQEPLRKIHSFGNLLQDQFGDQLGPAGSDIIHRMQMASGRMTTLIRDLLTYSRLTTHCRPFSPVLLGRLLEEIIDDIDPLLKDGQAVIDCGELPAVPGDTTQLRQLFQNLIINAVTFRHPDRPVQITIRCQTLEETEIPPGLSTQCGYVEISVADNGIGFDERYTDRIFQMFQRLHGRTQYTGTGVGLAICKRVVENHRGYITANGVPDEGATFRVVLPVCEDRETATADQ